MKATVQSKIFLLCILVVSLFASCDDYSDIKNGIIKAC